MKSEHRVSDAPFSFSSASPAAHVCAERERSSQLSTQHRRHHADLEETWQNIQTGGLYDQMIVKQQRLGWNIESCRPSPSTTEYSSTNPTLTQTFRA